MTQAINGRFDIRINPRIKAKAQKQLKKHGITLTEYIRSNLTTIANYGLPRNFGLNDAEEIKYEDRHWRQYPRFSSVKDAMRYLND